ncbi:carboxypeptidase C prc1 [Tritrichomonas musculus]|uniref:Carboxypeptidase C prc1 n=1 Tax=Tritrichomonas musculus TaxID=1915356 RepID=A0ABR2KUD1_9EUKA
MSLDFACDFNDAISTLQTIWVSMGLGEEEISKEKRDLEQEISKVFSNFVNSTSDRLHMMEQEIEDTLNAHAKLLRSFNHSEEEVNAVLNTQLEGTLKRRLQIVKDNYDKFHIKCEKQIMMFSSIQKQLDSLFEQLEITDKGEFSEVGDFDFSDERLEKYQKKLKDVKFEVKSRSDTMKQKKASVNKLLKELGETTPSDILLIFDTNSISDSSFKEVNAFIQDLEKEKDQRIFKMKEIANEITRLWDLLRVSNRERQEFLQAHSTISNNEISSCISERDRLRELRNQRLPELIEKLKEQIAEIFEYLQMAESSIPAFDETDPEKAFKLYEDELQKLENEKRKMSPYIDLITKREELLAEMVVLEKEAKKAAKLEGKGKPVDQKKQNRDEQARRRIRSLLPRLEKSLLIMLMEYKEDNFQNDFLWKGEPYIQKLSHIILSDVEINRAKKKNSRKKSMQPKKEVIGLIGEKGVSRRFSENNRMLVNFK